MFIFYTLAGSDAVYAVNSEAADSPLTSNVKLDLSSAVNAVRPLCVYV